MPKVPIDEREAIEILRQMVRIPSINPPGMEAGMVELLSQILDREEIAYETVFVEEGRLDVVATLPGRGDCAPLVFTGHMDLVPVSPEEQSRWNVNPFGADRMDDWIYGRGSADMKSGLAAALMAMISLRRARITPPMDIILAATIDEENLMKGSKALIGSPLLRGAKALVVCEPTDLTLARIGKGRTWAKVIIKGQTAHGSQQGVGQNAIELANDLMNKVRGVDFSPSAHPLFGRSFWRVLAIEAGVEPQVVPDRCSLTIDARLVPGHEPDRVWLVLLSLIEELKFENPGLEVELDIVDRREPWETPAEKPVVKACHRALEEMNLEKKETIFAGSTDGTILRRMGLDTIIIGPGDLSVVHRENERVSIAQYLNAIDLYQRLMLDPHSTEEGGSHA